MAQAERSFKSKKKGKFTPKKPDPVRALTVQEAEIAKAPAMERGARCRECPLFLHDSGPVFDEIVPNARLTVIGEQPAIAEIKSGRIFTSGAGQEAESALLSGGVDRSDCTYSSAALCRPPEDPKAFEQRLATQYKLILAEWEEACKTAFAQGEKKPPKPHKPPTPFECCFPRLQKTIEESAAPVVLALGGPALKAVADHFDIPFGASRKVKSGEVRIASLKRQLGSPLQIPQRENRTSAPILIATFHPAFAMRAGSRHYAHVIREHIKRAAVISRRGYFDWVEPDYILSPTVDKIEEVLGRFHRDGVAVTVDIETDQGTRADKRFDPYTCRIRCIGMSAVIEGEEVAICVPIRHISGVPWWGDSEQKRRVVQACANVLNDNPLVGHNLAFDTTVLLNWGLMHDRTKTWIDSMIAHRDTCDNDLPHDLGFVGSRYFEVPAWKTSADDKYTENVNDADLHLYNLRDCITTMRLAVVLKDEIMRWGTLPQFQQHTEMAPPVRDMGQLGFFIDERKRGILSQRMNYEALKRALQLKRKIVGDVNFNPNSPPQIRNFLFRKKGLKPVFNTGGRDWQEGEDPSTNTNSLIKLSVSPGVDAETKAFINLLLEYRAFKKLACTYIDNLPVTFEDWQPYVDRGHLTYNPGRAPAVIGRTFRKYKKKEKAELGTEADGVWEKGKIVLPERPAMSRLHVTYKLHVIPSSRLCVSPNVQAWPERGKANMRTMVIAPPGHLIVGADLDQVELRLYAAIANDKLLIKAFMEKDRDGNPMDAHSWNAASLFCKGYGMTQEECYYFIINLEKHEKKKLRNIAKIFVYLILYGGEAEKLHMYMSMARDKSTGEMLFPDLKESDVAEWFAGWHKFHPETRAWQQACERVAREEGYTSSPIGMLSKRFFMGGSNKPGATYNNVIQTSGSEIMNKAFLIICKKIPYQGWSEFSGVFGQVHDWVGACVPRQRGPEANQIIEEALNQVVFGIPITGTGKMSKRWSNQ